MVSYETVDERFPSYRRTDGVEQMLVPVPRCELCFKPIPKKFERTGQCYDCYYGSEIDGEVLERVVAATLYIPNATGYSHSREILDLKDRGDFADQHAEVLMYVLSQERLKFPREGVLVPVPQTKRRSAPTGPVALANSLSNKSGLPVALALSFIRQVKSQKGLSGGQRETNVRNSMKADSAVMGRPVYLVDDVLTTGNTMHEGARAVREAGATSAIGLVAGRDADLRLLEHAGVIRRVED